MALVKENGVPIRAADHGKHLLIGVARHARPGAADHLFLVKLIGTLPHPLLQLLLGGPQLEGLPAQDHNEQHHAVQQQQAAD